MEIKSHNNSLFNSATYRFGSTIVDPGDSEGFGENEITAVLLTHGHFDHIYGLNELLKRFPNALVYTNEYGAKMLVNDKLNMSKYHETPFVFEHPENIVIVDDGVGIDLDNGLTAKVYTTPGHNPSCLTFAVEDYLFTGDAYIPGIPTVVNLPHSNKADAIKSIEQIKSLAVGKIIYPGHIVTDCTTDTSVSGQFWNSSVDKLILPLQTKTNGNDKVKPSEQ